MAWGASANTMLETQYETETDRLDVISVRCEGVLRRKRKIVLLSP